MSGPALVPDAGAPSPPPAPPTQDGEFALLLGGDDHPSAHLAAIALPREVVLARRRRVRRRLLPTLRDALRDALPLAVLARWGRRLALALPPLGMLVVALWAAVAGIGSLVQVLRLLVTLQFAQAADALAAVDAAGRVLLACFGYFALLAALRVLARGWFGRGWSRLRLLSGLLVALPSAWLFIAGTGLAADAPPLAAMAPEWWHALVIALVLHAILVAVVGARPPEPGASSVERSSSRGRGDDEDAFDLDDPPAERLPLVRFGPPLAAEPPAETDMGDSGAMRVAGLLHALSPRDEPAGDEPARDEEMQLDAGHTPSG